MIISNNSAQGARPYQEDYHAFYSPPNGMKGRGHIFLLADGMGGMAAGATASYLAVEFFKNNYFQISDETPPTADIPEILGALLPLANKALLDAGVENQALWGMGTTLIAVVIRGNQLFFASVGDSHLYLRRGSNVRLLNEDHSVGGQIESMLNQGKITQEEAKSYDGQHHKLIHYLGNRHFGHFDFSREPIALTLGDQIIMCSDGLYGTLNDNEIGMVLRNAPAQTVAASLVQEAVGRNTPGQDNVTVQVVTMDGRPFAQPSIWDPAQPPAFKAKGIRRFFSHSMLAVAISLILLVIVGLIALQRYDGPENKLGPSAGAPPVNAQLPNPGLTPDTPEVKNGDDTPQGAPENAVEPANNNLPAEAPKNDDSSSNGQVGSPDNQPAKGAKPDTLKDGKKTDHKNNAVTKK